MGNLGAYQEFTTKAASVGGVDKLIKIIEGAAISKRAPWYIAGGLVAGAVLSELARAGYNFGSAKYAEYKNRQNAAEEAKADLRSAVSESDGSSSSSTPPSDPS